MAEIMIMHELNASKQGSVADANVRLSDRRIAELIKVYRKEGCMYVECS